MTHQYSPKRFFRNAPNRFLEQFFSAHSALTELDFKALTGSIFDALLSASHEDIDQ
jgi:hypothetical protein